MAVASVSENDDSKPLDPTEKRLNEALEKGNQPNAREAPLVALLVALLAALTVMAVPATLRLGRVLEILLDHSAGIGLDGQRSALSLMHLVSGEVALALAPFLLIFPVAGIAASMLQNRPRVIGERIRPDLSRLSPGKGLARMFGKTGWVEFAKAVAKLALVLAVLTMVLGQASEQLAGTMSADLRTGLAVLRATAVTVVGSVLASAGILLVLDLIWTRIDWRGRLRMTHQEMKDEMKSSDGDPQMKAKRQAVRRQRTRRMLADVPRAAVIITNPSHFAVALAYEAGKAGVPQVVAKGQDTLAQTIKALAAEHGVPMVEDVPLARALYRGVEVGDYIPREFYQALAEIIHFLQTRPKPFGPVPASAIRRRRAV